MDAGERADFLARECPDDAELRRDVERLLGIDDSVGTFLETPAFEGLRDVAESTPGPDMSGTVFGAYRLTQRIGTGGMGSVYLGERADAEFEKRVAVKVVRPGLESADIIQRFHRERQVLASLEHPHIARLIDGGSREDGVPYLVMEYVDGLPIDEFVRANGTALAERLRLFIRICDAVHYAHQRLVVHRDLKPSNILVTNTGDVKLLDFGIAKLLQGEGNTNVTRTVVRLMTPRYASPEQIRGEPVTTASDVYTLGILLYELLTDTHPFGDETTSSAKIERAICEEDPRRPSDRPDNRARTRHLRGDLDAITMTALRREPLRRYASARALGDDVSRYLAGAAVTARPDTIRYVVTRFVRRHVVSAGVVAALGIGLLAAAITSTVAFVRADRAQQDSERQRAAAEETARFLQNMLSSIRPETAQGRDATLLLDVLDRAAKRLDEEIGDVSVAASLHVTIGSTYRSLARFEEAERHLDQALTMRQRGEDPLALAEALHELGWLHEETSRFPSADSLLRRSVRLYEANGVEDRRLTGVLETLAPTLKAEAIVPEAEATYRRVLSLRREQEGPRSMATANALQQLGGFLVFYGTKPEAERLEEAQSHLEEAVAIGREAGDDAVLSLGLHDLGVLYNRMKRLPEAKACFEESLERTRRVWGDDHPIIAVTINSLGFVYERMGEMEKAESAYREALANQRARLGPEHVDVGTTLNNLAGLLIKVDRHEEALPLTREAVAVYEASLGPEHAWTAIACAKLTEALRGSGRLTEAEAAGRECLRIRHLTWADDHYMIAEIRGFLGACLDDQGRRAQADSLFDLALPALLRDFGEADPRVEDIRRRRASR